MTLARTWSVGLVGVRGALVEVELDIAQGLPGVALVGLPDAVVRQSVDRVREYVQRSSDELRRLDAVLEDTKPKVLQRAAQLQGA